MKTILPIAVAVFLVACESSQPTVSDTVITEADVVDDPALRVDPDGRILVSYLEGADDEERIDSSVHGQDRFPHLFSGSTPQTYCWIGDDVAFQHSLVLQTADGSELVRLSSNRGCVSADVPPGEASLILTHDPTDASGHSVFLVPTEPAGGSTASSGSAYRVLTDECRFCDLSGANFREMSLNDTDFTGASFVNANLSGANLGGSDLSKTDLRDANLEGAILTGAELSGAVFPVILSDQSAVADPVPPLGEETELDRLLGARLWTYGFDWIPNGVPANGDVIAFLSYTNGVPSSLAAFEVRHTAESDLHTLTFSRLSGTVSAERLDFTLTSDSRVIPITLIESDENHRSYQFSADYSTSEIVSHHLQASSFDVLVDGRITVQYAKSSEPINRFTKPVEASLERADMFAVERIGDDTGAPRKLEQHLDSFFKTLFSDESTPHPFRLRIDGLIPTGDTLSRASVPLLLATTISSSNLDDVIPVLAADIKSHFATEGHPTYDGLLFDVDVRGEDEESILKVQDAVLRTSAVSDL